MTEGPCLMRKKLTPNFYALYPYRPEIEPLAFKPSPAESGSSGSAIIRRGWRNGDGRTKYGDNSAGHASNVATQ